MSAVAISLDIGGTFTDFVVRDAEGGIETYKSSTTNGRISDGIFNGLTMIAERRGVRLSGLLGECRSFACGTTVATNAILERKTAKTALLCTEGFRDTLLIREGGKADTYNLWVDFPEPFLPRRLTFGITERMNAEGGMETPLDEAQVHAAIAQMKHWGVEAVAVSLLWSISNPAHEIRIGEIIAETWPEIPVSLGHQVHPTIREYRRTSATAIDASLKPIVYRNVNELRARLETSGFSGVLTLVTSNGGRTSIEEVMAKPVYLCMSGPSAIPHAGSEIARMERIDHGNIITVDMGGTSFDVSVTTAWQTPMHREGMIGGELFGVPSVEVLTIGAGGGSIARVDTGGFIHVGPESAGAFPGPACYGRGGQRATVTDANLVRGLIDPDGFADGQMQLSRAAAEKVIADDIGMPLGMTVAEAASLICLTIEQNMVGAIEEITVRRGVDPRDFLLVSGGSAGGLHAAAIARELGICRVIVPRAAGVLSAFGIDRGDVKFNFGQSLFTSSLGFAYERVGKVLAELEREGRAYLDRMGVPDQHRELQFTAEARYAGQVWQLSVPLARPEIRDETDLAVFIEAFHRLHETHYSVRSPEDAVEITEFNLVAIGRGEPRVESDKIAKVQSVPQPKWRRVFLKEEGGEIDLAVYDLETMPFGHTVEGPCLIQDKLTVSLVPSAAKAYVTEHHSILIDLVNPELTPATSQTAASS
ncbi:hydantoinase/oxoprolinase family protein [Acidisoma cellulosilytica]|uniref:Hydantoinase/oxoprolinase family protein n=1 Tax=Acidisoma cellulosilyticum TaxID=2802395 RepID=A0A964E6I6_9PROT|nr:hydantoinase/oxoprolinase family protein [Acidisoma cellulosilyticum]MCB8883785.1 hydantoinase/oxoprolinase family protein [Acidisoma cellulosilyticum]